MVEKEASGTRAAREPVRRLFFALWPDEPMRAELVRATRKAVRACGGRRIPVENLHLTLAFIGSVPESRLAELVAIASRIAAAPDAGPREIVLTLDRLEHWSKSQILCAAASASSDAARGLANRLKQALVDAGFAPDLKPFRAHVTLVRKLARMTREPSMPAVAWSFTTFSLVESRTDPGGSLYSVVDSWPLCAG